MARSDVRQNLMKVKIIALVSNSSGGRSRSQWPVRSETAFGGRRLEWPESRKPRPSQPTHFSRLSADFSFSGAVRPLPCSGRARLAVKRPATARRCLLRAMRDHSPTGDSSDTRGIPGYLDGRFCRKTQVHLHLAASTLPKNSASRKLPFRPKEEISTSAQYCVHHRRDEWRL